MLKSLSKYSKLITAIQQKIIQHDQLGYILGMQAGTTLANQ